MDENAVNNLEFHSQTVQADENSPLHLIREKEMEFSGRVLAAKREADEIVAQARHAAAALIADANKQAGDAAKEREAEVQVNIQKTMAEVRAQAEKDATALEATIESRRQRAVDFVVESTLTA